MPFNPDEYLAKKTGATFDPDAYISRKGIEVDKPGYGESLARGGAQGLSLGYVDEATAMAKAVRDHVMGRGSVMAKGPMDLYEQYRPEVREKYAAAKEANPKTYMGGAIAGSIAPAVAATVGTKGAALPAIAARLGTLGAVEALGHSEADLTSGDPGQYGRAALETLAGGTVGAVMPGAMKYGGKAIKAMGKPVVDLAKKGFQKAVAPLSREAGKRGLSAATNVPMESIEAYTKRPAVMKAATEKSYLNLAEKELVTSTKVLSDRTAKLYDAAMKTLDNKKPAFAISEINRMIGGITGGLKTKGITLSKDKGAAVSTLETLRAKINQLVPKKTTYKSKYKPSDINVPASVSSKSTLQPKEPILTQRDMKAVLDDIRADVKKWKPKPGESESSTSLALKDLQHQLNARLGDVNNGFRDKMAPVAEHMELLTGIQKKFGLEKFGPRQDRTYRAGKAAVQQLEQAPKERNVEARKLLQDLQRLTGKEAPKAPISRKSKALADYQKTLGVEVPKDVPIQKPQGTNVLGMAEDIRLAAPFKGGRTQGSRSVAQYAISGAGAGGLAGGGPGALVGGIAGAGVGSHVDKFGGQYAMRILDKVRDYKAGNILSLLKAAPEFFGEFAPILNKAAQRGGTHLITTNYILQQQSPEYRKQLKEIDDQYSSQPQR